MPIPRLPEDANPYELSVTINTKLRPYFEIWYQRKKEAGDTPEKFALRVLKTAALNDYIADAGKTAFESIEAAKAAEIEALGQDIQTLGTEVD